MEFWFWNFIGGISSPANYINGCTISNINLEDNSDGIRLWYAGEDSSNYNTFQNIYCNIEDHYQYGRSIWLEKEANYNQFSYCYIYQETCTSSEGAVKIFDSDHNFFTNIEILGNDADGFFLNYDSDYNTISSSEIYFTDNGISIHTSGANECNNNIIDHCEINSNENSCIYIDNCDGNTIGYNNLGVSGDSADYVIQLSSSSDTTIMNNVIKAADVGIGLYSDSNSNIITNNEISYCWSYGIEIQSSYSNEIHHNNFIENNGAGEEYLKEHIQAYDDVEPPNNLNSWENGYDPNYDPSGEIDIDIYGGNYWSDWSPGGPDYKCGPNQDEDGSDGIVDRKYIIDRPQKDKENDDIYPLKEPVELI